LYSGNAVIKLTS